MLFSLLFGAALCEEWTVTAASCFVKDGKYTVMDGQAPGAVAYAVYNNSIHADGWYRLHVHGNSAYPDKDIMHCAGMVEGYLTAEGMFNHYNLIKDIKGYPRGQWYPEEVHDFIEKNRISVENNVAAFVEDEWWQSIGLILEQFHGLVEGYERKTHDNTTMTMSVFDHWFFQSAGDMFDIAEMFEGAVADTEYHEHCTGMVKLTDDYSDIYFAHDAWSDFRELHGQLKEYDLPITKFKARRLVMSTRIGKLASYDDYYLSDAGLFVLETTLNNYNMDLYKVVVPQCVFTWLRAVHAMWTTDNGKDWAETFIRHNSGTYNNQYVIVDTNKFERGQKPTKDLLWIIEQFPGMYEMTDVTDQLVRDGYFPSINSPWHENLYEIAGYPELVASLGIYGPYRSAKEGPRYQIMMRDAPRIKTFEDFKAFMRYNQWYRDPFAQGDAAQQIASRYDLRPPTTPYGDRKAIGDLDSKCLRLTEALTTMTIHAFASPPYENDTAEARIPPWEFDQPQFAKDCPRHDGLPKKWNFSWVTFGADDYNVCSNFTTEKECIEHDKWCGWCMFSGTCMVGDKAGPFFELECESGWKRKTVLQSWAVPVIAVVTVLSCLFIIGVLLLHFFVMRKPAYTY